MKTLGETVKFNQDLNIDYNPNLIDSLKVYNPSKKEFSDCEHWGWNEEGENGYHYYDFGIIADFDFEITKTKTRFYFGDAPLAGFFIEEIEKLVVLPRGSFLFENFVPIGSLLVEKEYEVPKTMLDLANMIDNFLFEVTKEKMRLRHIHNKWLNQKTRPVPKNVTQKFDDLPF